ncbi:hypothetical protein TPR58_12990 [Sphingomonas sp. HF-S3]|uniref:Uncharacterized protein n=1 Tax=Sphingomonas rustica TaxID=3103142 RepID=A0ABV0B933_9SPHN
MRPDTILQFERLYFWGWLVGAVVSLAWFADSLDAVARSPGLGQGMIPALLVMTIIGLLIPLGLMWLIARRASVVAKWLLVVHVLATSVVVALSVVNWSPSHTALTLVTAAAAIVRAMSLKYLFTPTARSWFAQERPDPSPDIQG